VGYESRSKKKKQQQKKGGETKQRGRDALKHFFFFFFSMVALWRGVAQAQGLAGLTLGSALTQSFRYLGSLWFGLLANLLAFFSTLSIGIGHKSHNQPQIMISWPSRPAHAFRHFYGPFCSFSCFTQVLLGFLNSLNTRFIKSVKVVRL
jgi:hypothetical protein